MPPIAAFCMSTNNSTTVIAHQLDSILAGPFTGRRLVTLTIRLVDVCDLRHKRIVGVRIGEHGADGEEDFGDCQGRAPLVTQDVQANAAV